MAMELLHDGWVIPCWLDEPVPGCLNPAAGDPAEAGGGGGTAASRAPVQGVRFGSPPPSENGKRFLASGVCNLRVRKQTCALQCRGFGSTWSEVGSQVSSTGFRDAPCVLQAEKRGSGRRMVPESPAVKPGMLSTNARTAPDEAHTQDILSMKNHGSRRYAPWHGDLWGIRSGRRFR